MLRKPTKSKCYSTSKILWEHSSILGFDWLRGRYLLPHFNHWFKQAKGVVVDVGCGSKPYICLFNKSVSFYIGIDLPGNINVVFADIFANALQLPFKNCSVDFLFNTWVLDDLPNPCGYFQEVYRVLKPKGVFVMAENQSFPEHDAPNDFFRFTKYGLMHLARKNGFVVKEIRPLGGFWAQIGFQMTAFFLKGLYGHWGRWVRIFCPLINLFFYGLDRLCYLERGTSGYFAVFQKPQDEQNM